MSEAGDAQATGMTEAEAADVFEAMLSKGENAHLEGDDNPEDTPDEDDADEAEAEDGEESDETEESDEDEADSDPTYRVKVAGEEIEVPLSELLKGYSREADYTRKTQTLEADVRSRVEQEMAPEREALGAQRDRVTGLLEALEKALEGPLYDPAEMAQLRFSDPGEYAARMAEEAQRTAQRDAAKAEREAVANQAKQEAEQARAKAKAEFPAQLQKALPVLFDPAKGPAEMGRIAEYVKALGGDPRELSDTTDVLIWTALHEAAQFRALKAKTPQTREKVERVKTAKPGAATLAPRKTTDVTRARQRLAKTGREADAAAVFMHYIPD